MTLRNLPVLATLMALPLLLAGCQSSPDTQLDWGMKHSAARTQDTVRPKPRPQQYASYTPKPRCVCDDEASYDVPKPVARPTPAVSSPRWVKTEPAPDASFAWPVRGRVITNFGSTDNGGRNDGINIVAAPGTPIHAAADGTVSYAGNEVRSYGNLMLLTHSSGYVTAYAHADHFIVAKGEYVSKGQIIGYVGKTGDVASSQLHFELRKGLRGELPINPRPYLGPLQVAQR